MWKAMDHALSSGLKHNNGFEHSAPQKNTGLAGNAINSSPISVSSDPHETLVRLRSSGNLFMRSALSL